jgi:malonyl-CoA O-methyltransferase
MGCGAGEVYKNLKKTSSTFDRFIAIDFSSEMLLLHPSSSKIEKRCKNFNTIDAFEDIALKKKDILLSSSALQWSKNLDFTFAHFSKNIENIHLALFTSSTFRTVHKTANITSPIYTSQTLKLLISKYYDASYEVKDYRLYFENTRDMFRYIKKSGVSGGEKRLSFQETKKLLENYPLDYLEFEVLFVRGENLSIK